MGKRRRVAQGKYHKSVLRREEEADAKKSRMLEKQEKVRMPEGDQPALQGRRELAKLCHPQSAPTLPRSSPTLWVMAVIQHLDYNSRVF